MDIDWDKLLLYSSTVDGLDGVEFEHGRVSENGADLRVLTFCWDETRYTDDEVRDAKQRVLDLLKSGRIQILRVEHPNDRELVVRTPDSDGARSHR